jgi:hypothetical protein
VTDENAVVVSDVQWCITKNSPVVICRIKQIPSREPKFHHAEMLDGVGRSMNEWFLLMPKLLIGIFFLIV